MSENADVQSQIQVIEKEIASSRHDFTFSNTT